MKLTKQLSRYTIYFSALHFEAIYFLYLKQELVTRTILSIRSNSSCFNRHLKQKRKNETLCHSNRPWKYHVMPRFLIAEPFMCKPTYRAGGEIKKTNKNQQFCPQLFLHQQGRVLQRRICISA